MGTLFRKRKLEEITEPEMPRYAKTRFSRRRRIVRPRRIFRRKKTYMKRRYKRRLTINQIKRRTLPETKYITTSESYGASFRTFALQSSATASGHRIFTYDGSLGQNQFFPQISKGVNKTERVGDKITLTSARIILRISGQAALTNQMRYRIIIFRKPRDNMFNLPISDFLHGDPFTNLWFSNSSRRKEDTYRKFLVHYDKTFVTPMDSEANQNFTRDHKIVLKLGHTVMFDDTSVVNGIEYGDLGLILLANSGDTSAQTGLRCQINSTLYFVDP